LRSAKIHVGGHQASENEKKIKHIAISNLQRDALSFPQVRMEAHDLGVGKKVYIT
jgi:hypothetical protein